MFGEREALHSEASRCDPDRPLAQMGPTLSVIRFQAQHPSPARLQIDPDEGLDATSTEMSEDERLCIQTSAQTLDPAGRVEGHRKHSTLRDRSWQSPLNPEGISRI